MKLKYLILILILLFVIYQSGLMIVSNANTSIMIYGQVKEVDSESILTINGEEIDSIDINDYIVYTGRHWLNFGKNEIFIKAEDNSHDFHFDIYFFGLYSSVKYDFGNDEVKDSRKFLFP